MINLTQIILVVVITILTVLLTLIGIQVIAILKDVHGTLKRVNKIVDDAETITSAIIHPIANIGNLLEGIQSSVKIAEILGLVKDRTKQAVKEIPERVKDIQQNFREARQEVGRELADMSSESEAMQEESEPVKPYHESKPESRFPKFFHRSGTPLG